MNLLEHTIVKILSKPKKVTCADQSWWEVRVISHCYGRNDEATRIFDTEEEATQLKVGDIYYS